MKSYEAMEEEALAACRDIIEMLYQAGSGSSRRFPVGDGYSGVPVQPRIRVDEKQPDMEP